MLIYSISISLCLSTFKAVSSNSLEGFEYYQLSRNLINNGSSMECFHLDGYVCLLNTN